MPGGFRARVFWCWVCNPVLGVCNKMQLHTLILSTAPWLASPDWRLMQLINRPPCDDAQVPLAVAWREVEQGLLRFLCDGGGRRPPAGQQQPTLQQQQQQSGGGVPQRGNSSSLGNLGGWALTWVLVAAAGATGLVFSCGRKEGSYCRWMDVLPPACLNRRPHHRQPHRPPQLGGIPSRGRHVVWCWCARG